MTIDQITNKLYYGDCLEIMPQIPDKSIDMILCDLPYGTTACKWDTIIPFEPLWEQYKRIIKDNGAIVLTASQPFTSALVMSNPNMFKFTYVWKKERPTNPLLCKKRPPKYLEDVCVFYKSQPIFNPTYVKRKEENKRNNAPRNYSGEYVGGDKGYADLNQSGNNDFIYQGDLLEIPMERGLHPTQKPVALFEYLIKTYTNEGDLVLDNCAGSGTTGVACKNLNRKFLLIEKEQKYCEIAKRRLQNDIKIQ
jgi:site-specific DNA-methyltransferase (adenine-specific)